MQTIVFHYILTISRKALLPVLKKYVDNIRKIIADPNSPISVAA